MWGPVSPDLVDNRTPAPGDWSSVASVAKTVPMVPEEPDGGRFLWRLRNRMEDIGVGGGIHLRTSIAGTIGIQHTLKAHLSQTFLMTFFDPRNSPAERKWNKPFLPRAMR